METKDTSILNCNLGAYQECVVDPDVYYRVTSNNEVLIVDGGKGWCNTCINKCH